MSADPAWLAALATVGILLLYELLLAWMQRRDPQRLARSAHAALRQEWFEAISAQPGSEILAVQTLRNSMMSATMTASTAALGLMGTATLAVRYYHHAGFIGAMPVASETRKRWERAGPGMCAGPASSIAGGCAT